MFTDFGTISFTLHSASFIIAPSAFTLIRSIPERFAPFVRQNSSERAKSLAAARSSVLSLTPSKPSSPFPSPLVAYAFVAQPAMSSVVRNAADALRLRESRKGSHEVAVRRRSRFLTHAGIAAAAGGGGGSLKSCPLAR